MIISHCISVKGCYVHSSGNSDLKEQILQHFFLKDVEIKSHVALENTHVDLPLCRDLSSNRLVEIPPNLFLLLEDLLQLWVLLAQIRTRIHSFEYENSSVNVVLVSYKPWVFRSSAVPWLQLKLNFNRFYLHKYNSAHTCILHTCLQNLRRIRSKHTITGCVMEDLKNIIACCRLLIIVCIHVYSILNLD